MANGNGGPDVGGSADSGIPPAVPSRTTDDGRVVTFPGLTEQQADQIWRQQGTHDKLHSFFSTQQTDTPKAGATAVKPLQAAPEQTTTAVPQPGETVKAPPPQSVATVAVPAEGAQRYGGMVAGNLVRGAVEPLAYPGDINQLASQFTGGAIPMLGLPTSADIDRSFMESGVPGTGMPYQPRNWWERDLIAAPSQGVGQAATLGGAALYGPRVAGAALRSPVTGNVGSLVGVDPAMTYSLGSSPGMVTGYDLGGLPRTLASGAAGSTAATGTEDIQQNIGVNQQFPGVSALAPIAAGTIVGSAAGGPLAGRFMPGGGSPYNNLTSRIGVNFNTETPYMSTAARNLQNEVLNNPAGQFLPQEDREAILGKTAANTPGATLKPATEANLTKIVKDPDMMTRLRQFIPGVIDDSVAPAVVAKAGSPTNPSPVTWNGLKPVSKEALFPDFVDRSTLDQQHATPQTRGQFWYQQGQRALIGGGIGAAGVAGDIGHHIWEAAYGGGELLNDKSLMGAIMLAGAVSPYVRPAARYLANRLNLAPAQTGIAAGTGLGPATSLPLSYRWGPQVSGQQSTVNPNP